MNKMLRVLLAIVVVLVFGSIFIAQTQDNTAPNQPIYPNAMQASAAADQFCDSTGENSAWPPCNTYWDNECELGGQLEGRCETEYDWQLGWWSARFNQGHLTREQIPSNFQHNFPENSSSRSIINETFVPTNTIDPSLPTYTPTNTSVAPTAGPSETPTNTSVAPTAGPSETPTNTSVAPTETATDTPTNTSVAPTDEPTETPTDTSIPPTDEPTATATPTDEPTATATPT